MSEDAGASASSIPRLRCVENVVGRVGHERSVADVRGHAAAGGRGFAFGRIHTLDIGRLLQLAAESRP